jgi:hypothetical protein
MIRQQLLLGSLYCLDCRGPLTFAFISPLWLHFYFVFFPFFLLPLIIYYPPPPITHQPISYRLLIQCKFYNKSTAILIPRMWKWRTDVICH